MVAGVVGMGSLAPGALAHAVPGVGHVLALRSAVVRVTRAVALVRAMELETTRVLWVHAATARRRMRVAASVAKADDVGPELSEMLLSAG